MRIRMRHCAQGRNGKGKYYVITGALIMFLYLFSTVNVEPRYVFANSDVDMACIIPDPNPFDESIKPFDWHPDPIHCAEYPSLVYVDDKGQVVYNHSAMQKLKISGLDCSYNIIHRGADNDDDVVLGKSRKLIPPEKVKADFFLVKCTDVDSNRKVFDSVLHNIDADSVKMLNKILDESPLKPSVFIFGIDAVSRLAAIRKLPKTYKYLLNDLGGYEFKGYMKVADNTFPNVVPMLTGKQAFSEELPHVDFSRDHFDSYPFIWNEFSKKSYATMFAEDYPDLAMFNLGKQGFISQPTNHYMRPFWRGVKKTDLADFLLDAVLIGFENKKMKLRKKSSLCYGNKPKHTIMLDYYKQFMTRYSQKRRFGFLWLNEISHNYVNFLELGDDDFKDFLKWTKSEGHLENSILFFLSDHGSRIDEIRNTFVGRIEERMPQFIMVVPDTIKQKYPALHSVLNKNKNRLTTHYDLYQTLQDVLHGNFEEKVVSKSGAKYFPRGISLFSTIPPERSCADAGISEHFCACYKSSQIDVKKSKVVPNICDYVLSKIHLLLENYFDQCEKLSVFKIHEAQEILPGLKDTGDKEFFSIWNYFLSPEKDKEKRYLVVFETVPGHAMFEATVQILPSGEMDLLGHISRTNKYGKTSSCITDHNLHLYCYCKIQPV